VSDVGRLLNAFASGNLLPPSSESPNTVDLALAIAAVAGAPSVRLTPAGRDIREQIQTDHLVFVLVDGLGMNLIDAQPSDAFLRSHAQTELRAVFPSTTATALTSLATGLWPAQHAIPGWWTYLPEHRLTSTILPFVERFTERPLTESGLDPASVYLAPSLATSFARDTCSFLPEQIAASAYTQYVTGGGKVVPYQHIAITIDRIIQRVRAAGAPTYTYLYFPVIDALEHAVGPHTPQVSAAVRALDRQLARLAAGLGESGHLVVSADHGLTTVEDSEKHLVPADIQELLLVPPSGEPRVPYFHVKDGRSRHFAARFRERFGEQFVLLSIDEADDMRLFGPEPLTDTARARIGDFVGIALGHDVLLSAEMQYRGFHGALTADEMRIPLVIA
jgi:Type I phosphodiesterase / nucleotide pyrophosphatase